MLRSQMLSPIAPASLAGLRGLADKMEKILLVALDNYGNTPAGFASKDASKSPYQIVHDPDVYTTPAAALPYTDNVLLRQGTSVVIPAAAVVSAASIVSSPSVFVKFNYTEPLGDNFLLAYVRDTAGHVIADVRLQPVGAARAAVISLADFNVTMATPAISKRFHQPRVKLLGCLMDGLGTVTREIAPMGMATIAMK